MAFQGIPGSFSSTAAQALFGDTFAPLHAVKFRDIFEAVVANEATYGVIPVENTLAGSVHENYDLLAEYPLWITREYLCPVQLHLLSKRPLQEVRRVISHPKALEQCTYFLRNHSNWTVEPWSDTARAAQHVATSDDPSLAAIASEEAARLYNVPIVSRTIQDHDSNVTRFVVIEREQPAISAPSKCSVIATLAHHIGALESFLKAAAQHSLNLTKIEARSRAAKPFEYSFHLDLTRPALPQSEWEGILSDLRKETTELRILGLYEHAR